MASENQTVINSTLLMVDTEEKWIPPDFDITATSVVIAIVLTTLDVVTLFGNLIVLIAFLVDSKLRQPFNLFIMNLAVTDICVAITAMPFYTIDTLLGYWPFGQVMCGVWIYFDFAMTFASVFTMVAISVDRFWCVTWAIHYKAHNNISKTVISLGIVWLCVFSIWTPPFIADRLANEEVHYCIWEPNKNRQFVLFVAVIGHYVPCFIMVFCYVKVFVIMKRKKNIIIAGSTNKTASATTISQVTSRPINEKRQAKLSSSHESDAKLPTTKTEYDGHVQKKDSQQFLKAITITTISSTFQKKGTSDSRLSPNLVGHSVSGLNRDKIFITLTYILACYLICWFPFYVTFDTYAWRPELVPSGLYSFFFWMTYVNSTLNPFIYAYTSKDFRIAFLRVLRFLYSCKIT